MSSTVPARRLPRLRHDAARRRAAGGPQPLRRRQAHHRAAASTSLGVGYIEGGWPGANPKDTEFFRRATEELDLQQRRRSPRSAPPGAPGVAAADDPLVAALRDSGASVVTLVAKSHDRHVELALRTTLEENLAMVRDTVTHLREEGQRVFLDAEHFFDGYRDNRDYALEVLRTAYDAGAEVVALCDTNGGMLPAWVGDVVDDVLATHRRPGRHPLPQRHRLRGREHAGRRRRRRDATSRARSTATASAPATPTWSRWWPTSSSSCGRPVLPRGQAARRHPDRARGRRGDQLPARLAPAVRRRERVRAQGRAARQRDQGRPEPLPAHGADARRQRHAAAGLGHGRPREHRAQGRRARVRPRRRPTARSWSPGSPTGSRSWSRAATRSRPPTRRSSCCSSRRSRAPGRRTSRSSRGG